MGNLKTHHFGTGDGCEQNRLYENGTVNVYINMENEALILVVGLTCEQHTGKLNVAFVHRYLSVSFSRWHNFTYFFHDQVLQHILMSREVQAKTVSQDRPHTQFLTIS